jgi:hypothetical protein
MRTAWRFLYVFGYVLGVFLFRSLWRRLKGSMGAGKDLHPSHARRVRKSTSAGRVTRQRGVRNGKRTEPQPPKGKPGSGLPA